MVFQFFKHNIGKRFVFTQFSFYKIVKDIRGEVLSDTLYRWLTGRGKEAGRTINHSVSREFIWTCLPAVILFLIAIPSVKLLYAAEFPNFASSVYTVKAIGHQWFWSYEYLTEGDQLVEFDSYMLDSGTVLEEGGLRLLEVTQPLVLPTLEYVRVLVSSVDVLHSWAVPSFGVKVDAVPGRVNQLYLYIKREGIFYGQCSEICGVNHGFMPIKIISRNV
jgi:cytochrome c oxidase subunit 2